ncbi:hypothetical protein [Spirosoma rhododendri]|uniref:Uncharacterized protein n=1 Tax=Spirosoma rhododendri TaxID=2728024 RepID=A0A7L5DN06_9BACT|nr:hypothetical protein [Spirosoma rhododendri]QJD79864.1 hypothetical protein HH216_16655 [Spirosoma rhododendri]
MIWTLHKRAAKAAFMSTAAALMGRHADRVRQQRLLGQIDRVISRLKQAHSLHPAWLKQQYGTLDGYLKCHLSADDWQYVLQIRQAELPNERPVPGRFRADNIPAPAPNLVSQ